MKKILLAIIAFTIALSGLVISHQLEEIKNIEAEQLRFINEQADTVNVISCRLQNKDEAEFMHCLYDNY